jgi:fructose-bisphosphate aldolase class I
LTYGRPAAGTDRLGAGVLRGARPERRQHPKALAEYGIDESRYDTEAEMFDLVHEMRTRVITNPAFDGTRILGAILFEQTMERDMLGIPTPRYLWEQKQVVPFSRWTRGSRTSATASS